MRKIKIGGKYRHFKGGIYEILAVAKDCENPERELVIYKSLYESPDYPKGTIWVREKSNFLEKITRDEKSFLRFEEVRKDV